MIELPGFTPTPTEKAEAGALFEGAPVQVETRPWWLVDPPAAPKRAPWPPGAWGPYRIELLKACDRAHAAKYKHNRDDPPGLEAQAGRIVHFALEAAALRRLNASKSRPIPAEASAQELLHLAEHHPEAGLMPIALDKALETIRTIGPVPFKALIAVEQTVVVHVTPSLVLAAVLDVVSSEGDPVEPLIVVTDYKSGAGLVPDEQDLWHEAQVAIALIAMRRAYPKARGIVFRLWNLFSGDMVEVRHSQRMEETFLASVRSLVARFQTGIETARPSEYCSFCAYRSDCQPAKDFVARQRKLEVDLSRLTLEELAPLYKDDKATEKIVGARQKDARKAIQGKLGKKQLSHRTKEHVIRRVRGRSFGEWKRDPLDLVEWLVSAILASESSGSIPETARRRAVMTRLVHADVLRIDDRALRAFVNMLPEQLRAQARQRTKEWIEKRRGSWLIRVEDRPKDEDKKGGVA